MPIILSYNCAWLGLRMSSVTTLFEKQMQEFIVSSWLKLERPIAINN